jgi:hypothetical protein
MVTVEVKWLFYCGKVPQPITNVEHRNEPKPEARSTVSTAQSWVSYSQAARLNKLKNLVSRTFTPRQLATSTAGDQLLCHTHRPSCSQSHLKAIKLPWPTSQPAGSVVVTSQFLKQLGPAGKHDVLKLALTGATVIQEEEAPWASAAETTPFCRLDGFKQNGWQLHIKWHTVLCILTSNPLY